MVMNLVRLALKCFPPNQIIMSPSSRIHVTVVGTGSPGTPKSVLLCTDKTRYLINCGEGTQRILTEHKSKASKITHVFFTRMSWRHLSGLLGIGLTVKTAGVKRLFVHGPSSVVKLTRLTRHFADASTSEIVQSDILQTPLIDDDFRITAFELNDDETEPPIKARRTDNPYHSQPIYAYLFQCLKQHRKLDPAKCIACGMPSEVLHSPKVRQLIEGYPLILDDGRVISPSDVTSEPIAPRNILVLECPHEACIARFLQADGLFNAIASSQDSCGSVRGTVQGIDLVIHMVPAGLFEVPEYQALVTRLNQYGQHVELPRSKSNEGGGVKGTEVEIGEEGLHHLVLDGSSERPACFPVSGIFSQSTVLSTYFDSKVYPQLGALRSSKKPDLSNIEPFSRVVYAQPMLLYNIRPHSGFSTENCLLMDEKELLQQSFDPLYMTEAEAAERCKKMLEEVEAAAAEKCKVLSPLDELEWPEFTFLGTASSSPSKYRNISAILVRLSSDDCVLLDCAEGTLNQFYALYGVDETHNLLRGLRLILITHMHADHHGGVMTVARKVHELTHREEGLAVLAPPPFWRWVNSYSELFATSSKHVRHFSIDRVYEDPMSTAAPAGSNKVNTSNASVNPIWRLRQSGADVTVWSHLLSELKLRVEPVRVPHTGTSWAYILSRPKEEGSVWRVVYSGDTPPCAQLAEAGRGCDLLIHEATMADGYEEQAVAARHSTTSEAIEIGRLMQAKFILLTHFSQRFSRLPSFDTFQEDIAPAFDFMQVKFRDLWKLPYYLPYYKYAFARHWELLQNRADANYQRKMRAEEALQQTRHVVSDALGVSGKG